MTNKEIETWEKYYLDQIEFMLLKDKNKMINALNSKDVIEDDWIEVFKESTNKNSNFNLNLAFLIISKFGLPFANISYKNLLFEFSNFFISININDFNISFSQPISKSFKKTLLSFVIINHRSNIYLSTLKDSQKIIEIINNPKTKKIV